MGHKVNPISLHLNITEIPRSRWFASKKAYRGFVIEDARIRKMIKSNYGFAGIVRVDIERTLDNVTVYIHTSNPGLIIGRKGSTVDRLTEEVERLVQKKVNLRIVEVQNPDLSAQLLAEAIAIQLQKRASHRRVMHKIMDTAMAAGAQGIRLVVSGRIAGAEIARRESMSRGKVPLQTLRAVVDYGFTEALITKGKIGIKVWLYKGEQWVKDKEDSAHAVNAATA